MLLYMGRARRVATHWFSCLGSRRTPVCCAEVQRLGGSRSLPLPRGRAGTALQVQPFMTRAASELGQEEAVRQGLGHRQAPPAQSVSDGAEGKRPRQV